MFIDTNPCLILIVFRMGFKVHHPDNIIELAVLIVKAAANSIAVRGKIVVNMAAPRCEISNQFLKDLNIFYNLISPQII